MKVKHIFKSLPYTFEKWKLVIDANMSSRPAAAAPVLTAVAPFIG